MFASDTIQKLIGMWNVKINPYYLKENFESMGGGGGGGGIDLGGGGGGGGDPE